MNQRALILTGIVACFTAAPLAVQVDAPQAWLLATAYAIPKETTNEGSGYFSIVEGQNGKLYIGTAKYGVNSCLVEFDPATKQMKHRRRYAQGDRHGPPGLRHPGQDPHPQQRRRQRQDLFRHQAGLSREEARSARIIPAATRWSTTRRPARRRSTRSRCRTRASSASRPTSRAASPTSPPAPTPGPENSHFLILDLKTGKYRDLIDTQHIYGFIVVDHLGRAYHPIARRRHRPLRPADRQAGTAEADDRRQAAGQGVAPGPARNPPDQLGHLARRQDAVLPCR